MPDWSIGMKTESEIRAAGMSALVTALRSVEAERFIASLSRERFDYTEWRRLNLPTMTVEQIHSAAMASSASTN